MVRWLDTLTLICGLSAIASDASGCLQANPFLRDWAPPGSCGREMTEDRIDETRNAFEHMIKVFGHGRGISLTAPPRGPSRLPEFTHCSQCGEERLKRRRSMVSD